MLPNRSHAFIKVIIFFLLLLLSQRGFAQAGVDQWAPDDIFAPIQNQYYIIALSSLMSLENNSDTQLPPSAYNDCLENIKRVYAIEGNYAGALDLLSGIPKQRNYDLAHQFTDMPTFSMNMQQVINVQGIKTNADLLQAHLYEVLAEIYEQIGNPLKGLAYQLKACEILKKQKSSDKAEYIKQIILLGEKYISVGQIDRAEEIFNNEVNKMPLNKETANYVRYQYLKAMIFQKHNKLYDAIDIFKQIFSNNSKEPQYYEMALNLGRLYCQTRQYQLADSVLGRNFSVLHRIGYKSVIFDQTVVAWCENLLYMNKSHQASKTLISLSRWVLYSTQINSMGMSEDEELTYAKRMDEILNVLYTILSKNTYPENQKLMLDVLSVELQYRNLVLLNKKDLRKQSQQEMYFRLDKDGTYKPIPGTKTILAQQYSLPYTKRYPNTDSLEESSEQSDRKISSSGFSVSPYDDIKSKALDIATQGGIANIEYVRFNYKAPDVTKDSAVYAAFIFEQSFSSGSFVSLCSDDEILQLMKDENGEQTDEDQLSENLYSSSGSHSHQLYKFLFEPLVPYLKGINEINYSPAAILNNISIGAIYNGKDYLFNVYNNVHFFSSLTDASVYNAAYEKPAFVNAWGNIDYNNAAYTTGIDNINYKSEPNTSPTKAKKQTKDADTSLFDTLGNVEINYVKQTCNKYNVNYTSCDRKYATEDSFKNIANSHLKGVLHICTHGFYIHFDKQKEYDLLPANFMAANKNALFRTGLAFSGVNYYWKNGSAAKEHDDGILNAWEIEQLDLHNVQLVVLSACETGLGDSTYNEGNVGLPRAFKLAGAHYVLATLWRVNPKATAEFLKFFYDNWFGGQPLPEALKNAQNAIRLQHPSPYFWAGFVLIE